jgi:hypothetical protein
MYWLFSLVILVSSFLSIASASNLPNEDYMEKLRLTYYKSVEDKDAMGDLEIMIFSDNFRDSSKQPPIILAYQGAFEALKAKHAFWPVTKLNYLNKSLEILGKAIEIEPNNLEIRFLRFSILHHVPGILGHGEETHEDAEVIYELVTNGYTNLSLSLQRGFVEFLIDSDRLSEEQNHLLRRKFALAKLDE